MKLYLILTAILTISMTTVLLLPSLDSKVYAITNVNNTYFSINIPDDWAYAEGLSSVAQFLGGADMISLTPNGVLLLNNTRPLEEKMKRKVHTLRLSTTQSIE
jgi:hypothetical protein